MSAKKILIVEDEPSIADYLTIYCKAEGYEVFHAEDGISGFSRFLSERPDFVLLDLMLPGLDGVEVCRRIRSVNDVPVIMVTARSEEVDKLLGLEIGADDYITKPFSPRELMARIRVIFRRLEKVNYSSSVSEVTTNGLNTPHLSTEERFFDLGRLKVNKDTREATYDNQIIPSLTNKEYDLLLTLARRPGRVYSKNELEEALYGCDSLIASRAVGVHISNLRSKLPNPKLVETVHGVGYKISREQL